MIEETLVILGAIIIGFVYFKQRLDNIDHVLKEISLILDDIDNAFREAGADPLYDDIDDDENNEPRFTVAAIRGRLIRVFSKDELRKKK